MKNKSLNALPFQLQISYTKLNGMKCIRVITREQKGMSLNSFLLFSGSTHPITILYHTVTWDRSEAERTAKVDVLGLNAMQQTAQIAQQGRYSSARLNNYTHLNMLQRVAKYVPLPHSPAIVTRRDVVLILFFCNYTEIVNSKTL